jgi:hypothetical protein
MPPLELVKRGSQQLVFGRFSFEMARNRKNRSAAIRFGPAVNAFVLCLLVGGSGIGYVWQKNQIYTLGQDIKKREVSLSQLHDQNEQLNKQLALMRSPGFLMDRIEKLNLGLGPPQPGQVCRLDEPRRDTPRSNSGNPEAGPGAMANLVSGVPR